MCLIYHIYTNFIQGFNYIRSNKLDLNKYMVLTNESPKTKDLATKTNLYDFGCASNIYLFLMVKSLV